MMAVWRRLRALSAADRRLLAEAAWLLLVCRIGLWVLPYARLRRAVDGTLPPGREPPRDFPDRVSWAIGALARRLPAMTCLVQSIAAHALLRRAGCRAELRIGVQAPVGRAARRLDAHAWVECEGRVVVGDVPGLAEYAVLRSSAPPADDAATRRS
jgi:hypothetical protein